MWPWMRARGILLEGGRDGKTAYGRLQGKSATVQGMSFAEGILWKRKRAGGPLGKFTCMWEDGVYLSDHCGVHRGESERCVADENCTKETRDRSNLEMVVAVPWRRNEDDPKMDGERLKSELVVMDKEYREKLETEEFVPVPKRVYISRENLEDFGFTPRCPGCTSLRDKRTRKIVAGGLKRVEGHRKGGCGDETHDRIPRQSCCKRNEASASQEEGPQQRELEEPTVRMEEDVPASSSSGKGDVAPTQSSSSSGSAARMSGREGGDGCKEDTKKRKAEEEHSEDPERGDGKWMRTEGNMRKAGEEETEEQTEENGEILEGT